MDKGDKIKSFLGAGFHFPVCTDDATGKIKMVALEEDIKQSIYLILMTRKGERVMHPDFGCDIHDYAFATMDTSTLIQIRHSVMEALTLYEPRISEVDVNLNMDKTEEGKVLIEISYVVRRTNNPFNLVYPFYINEGMGA